MTGLGPAAPVASPCTGVCRIDEATGLCIGCGRSLDEIARWTVMDEAQRQRIRERLAGRAADAD
jgi:predicted Fe-S protein YdhL (DUF1289 family)